MPVMPMESGVGGVTTLFNQRVDNGYKAAAVNEMTNLRRLYREGGKMIMRYGTAQYSTPPLSNPNKNYTTLQRTSISASLVTGEFHLGLLAM